MSRRRFAFLRGINVGGKTVTRDRLLPVFEGLGFERVESFLASGNAIFDAPPRTTPRSLETKIEQALERRIGLTTKVFVRTPEELVAIAACPPFDETELAIARPEGALNVSLFAEEPSPAAREAIESLSTDDDRLRFAGRELYWVSRTKMSQSPLFAVSFEKKAGLPATMRNLNTIRRLVERYVDES